MHNITAMGLGAPTPVRSRRYGIPIPQEDYEAMYRVGRSVLDAEGANPANSSLLLNLVGCYLLDQVYGMDSRLNVGATCLLINEDSRQIVTIGERHGPLIFSTEENFHSWIEAEGYVMDLSAPSLPEMHAARGMPTQIPRRMNQRHRIDVSVSVAELRNEGDVAIFPNAALREVIVPRFLRDMKNIDLAARAAAWFRKPPAELEECYVIRHKIKNVLQSVDLTHIRVEGAW